jgi:choline dehydrogenase-like flavoprotein
MPYDFDLIVVGSGAGGGTFAYACASAGKNVLLVERGNKYTVDRPTDEQEMLIEKRPYDDRIIRVNGRARRLYIGGVFGGSTALFGAALVRPSALDFHPGRFYADRLPRSIWDWPIDYPALEPYYNEAEKLYGVAGCAEDDFGPLEKPGAGFPRRPIPLRPINEKLVARNHACGLKPFHLPLAINFQICSRCSACPGHLCPTGARSTSAQLVDEAVHRGNRLHVLMHAEAERFYTQAGRVAGVVIRDRGSRQRTMYRARRYALAAGAIGSPALLLRSGIDAPLVGRNYMFHLSPVSAAIFPERTGADETFVKQVGFADYYLGTPDFSHKLGLIQSLPIPGPLMMARNGATHLPARWIQYLRQRMLALVGIVEDLPNPSNRVTLDKDQGLDIHHAFSPYDRERGRRLSALMGRILKRAGALFCLSKAFPSEEHVAHQCGTLRFGRSPQHAVADPECRLFSHPDLFVVDGSIFPTSLGVGPALTIIANALRVARVVVQEI